MNEYLDFAIDFARTAGKIMQENLDKIKALFSPHSLQ